MFPKKKSCSALNIWGNWKNNFDANHCDEWMRLDRKISKISFNMSFLINLESDFKYFFCQFSDELGWFSLSSPSSIFPNKLDPCSRLAFRPSALSFFLFPSLSLRFECLVKYTSNLLTFHQLLLQTVSAFSGSLSFQVAKTRETCSDLTNTHTCVCPLLFSIQTFSYLCTSDSWLSEVSFLVKCFNHHTRVDMLRNGLRSLSLTTRKLGRRLCRPFRGIQTLIFALRFLWPHKIAFFLFS